MADYKLIGKDYQTPDLVAKVTGRAKFAEDFRADGMLMCKLLLSPMPHARVRRLDTRDALAMPGVAGILTADDLPPTEEFDERALTNEPVYEGEPILALAAVDEYTAAAAIEKIRVDLEPLPFVVDPLESLRPGTPTPRPGANVFSSGLETDLIKWTARDFEEVAAGRLPWDVPVAEEHIVGDVAAAFDEADLVLDETLFQQSTTHQPLESRSSMAYWQNGKLYLYGSTQSLARTVASVANWVGIDEQDVVVVSQYTGGGFGSKIPGVHSMAIPALLSRKVQRPVMMRISREEETYIGRVRPGFQSRVRMGFRKDGRLLALDLLTVQASGPYRRQGDVTTCGACATVMYTPLNLRLRGISAITNTPPPVAQRAPGGLQASVMFEPMLSHAARELGLDQVEIRKINAPVTGSPFGISVAPDRPRPTITSAFVREAFDKGAALFNWEERKQRSGQRRGTKVTGVSATGATFVAGSIGFDGIVIIKPDGRIYVHQGVGNLGTHSVMDTARIVPEVLESEWERCEVIFGSTANHVPWSSSQSGSQTTHAHTRANHAAAMDCRRKLQEIAARDLGGQPEQYDVADGRVFRRGSPGTGLTFAQAAQRAIALGGRYDGHEPPENVHEMTKASAVALAGQGLMGVARDDYGRDGSTYSFVIAFCEVEVDVETGEYRIVDYVGVPEVGTVIHPRSLGGQVNGGAVQGFGHVHGQKLVYDQRYGVALAKRFYHNKPPTILDVPNDHDLIWEAVGIPDPQTPVGAKGVGEAAVCAGGAAVMCALADALRDQVPYRTPVQPEMVMAALRGGRAYDPLTAFI